MIDNPIARLGDLSKPATVLVEKISDAVGGVFRPYQVVRVAKAEAEADKIRAESQIQITDLHRRAMHRFLEEEAKRQLNIESITEKALPLLEDNSKPHDVNDDWIINFFDNGRIISDSQMQQLWAKVLAGEANLPGAFAKQTVNLLANLDKSDAELFIKLCSFCWKINDDNNTPLIFDTHDKIYTDNGVFFNTIYHLESLGLIKFDHVAGFRLINQAKDITAIYYGKSMALRMPKDSDNELSVGNVLFTRAGLELSTVCSAHQIDGFPEYVYQKWSNQSIILKMDL